MNGEKSLSISDENWDHIETRLLNALSVMEQHAIADFHSLTNRGINCPLQRLRKIIEATDLDMVPSLRGQLDITGLQYSLAVLLARIDFLLSSYLE
jgi:hypothetical protein